MKICPVCRCCYEDEETACARDSSVLVPARPGARVVADKYRLDRLLGRGGMGAVYAGAHVELERPAAIKLLLPDLVSDAQALERFRREARAAARLNHPNVADTYDYGILPSGEAYIVMELVEGQTLREYMDAARLVPFADAAAIARQVADGIEAAHRSHIIHRDLKPSNIILTRDHHDALLAKVVDFGIAKLKEHTTTGGTALTNTGALVGTPRYMSPEQCSGSEIDARSDIYSLGVILYEMLAGRPPFDAPSATAIALKHVQGAPPPLAESRPQVPEALAALVAQALAKDPRQRPQTASDFSRGLRAAEEAVRRDGQDESESSSAQPFTAGDRGLLQTNPAADTHRDAPDTGGTGSAASTGSHGEGDGGTGRAGIPTAEELSAESSGPSADGPAQPVVETVVRQDAATPEAPALAPEVPAQSSHAARDNSARAERPRNPKTFPYPLIIAAAAIAVVIGLGLFLSSNRRPPSTPDANAPDAAAPDTRRAQDPQTDANARPALGPSPEVSRGEGLNGAPADERRALRRALDEWVEATNARDINRQMSFYAPSLTAFYRDRNVPQSDVRAEKERTFGQATLVRISVVEPDIKMERDGRTAVLRFRKQYLIEGGGQNRRGTVLQELRWEKSAEGWRITSERDLEVLP